MVVVVVGCINRCLGFRFGLGDLGWCSFGGFGFLLVGFTLGVCCYWQLVCFEVVVIYGSYVG